MKRAAAGLKSAINSKTITRMMAILIVPGVLIVRGVTAPMMETKVAAAQRAKQVTRASLLLTKVVQIVMSLAMLMLNSRPLPNALPLAAPASANRAKIMPLKSLHENAASALHARRAMINRAVSPAVKAMMMMMRLRASTHRSCRLRCVLRNQAIAMAALKRSIDRGRRG